MKRRPAIILCIILVFGVGFVRVFGHRAHAANPNALWQIVHEQCVPNMRLHSDPKPCAIVNLSNGEAKGYAVLKDIRGIAQFLLIPTAQIAGIESPELLAPDAPNYWQEAWAARRFMTPYLKKQPPDDDIALAINSREGRSQNQLHIHIDCIRPDVKQILIAHQAAITASWSRFPIALAGHVYQVMRITGADFSGQDLFKLLAATNPAAKEKMANQTLAAVSMAFDDGHRGFVILNDHVSVVGMDRASSEQVLDHGCAVL